jgi:nucleotide-binding universal stress UspA family protein
MDDDQRIIVGVDGSDASAVALDWAIDEARRRAARLEVVHAWDVRPALDAQAIPAQPDPAVQEAAARAVLDESIEAAGARAGASGLPDVCAVLVRGTAARSLESIAEGATLLVVGSHGLGPISTAVLGSVSAHCVNHATSPTTVVRQEHRALPGDGRVVVGVDRSEPSRIALRWAAEEAGLRAAPLVVVHAIDVYVDSTGAERPHELEAERRPEIEAMVAAAVDGLDPAPASVEVLLPGGGPGHVLVDVAAGAGLLVVGAAPRHGLRRVLGSVSRHCLHNAPCPITVLRTP